jgi:hypothetical protein
MPPSAPCACDSIRAPVSADALDTLGHYLIPPRALFRVAPPLVVQIAYLVVVQAALRVYPATVGPHSALNWGVYS